MLNPLGGFASHCNLCSFYWPPRILATSRSTQIQSLGLEVNLRCDKANNLILLLKIYSPVPEDYIPWPYNFNQSPLQGVGKVRAEGQFSGFSDLSVSVFWKELKLISGSFK